MEGNVIALSPDWVSIASDSLLSVFVRVHPWFHFFLPLLRSLQRLIARPFSLPPVRASARIGAYHSPDCVAEGMTNPLIDVEPAYDISDEYRPEPEPIPAPPAWQDGSFRIGIHTSIAGDIAGALDIASKLGANALQIFSASPRMWPGGGTRIADADAARFRARRTELGLGPLVIHGNYLINLASPERVMRTRSIQAFHDELIRAVSLGADFLVAHPGSGLGTEKSQAITEIAQGMRQAAQRNEIRRPADTAGKYGGDGIVGRLAL